MARDIQFKEVQKFKQLWLWLIILIPAGLAWFGFIQQIIFKKPFGNNPAPDIILWVILVLCGIGLPIFFYSLKMRVELTSENIHIRFWPFVSRRIAYKDIKSCEPRQYKPIREYGGWGVRYAFKKGWAYNVRGNWGVQLELVDGKRILIGLQDAEKLSRLINEAMRDKM